MAQEVIVRKCECGEIVAKRHTLCEKCFHLHKLQNNRVYRAKCGDRLNALARDKWHNDVEFREKHRRACKRWAENNMDVVRSLSLKWAKINYATPDGKLRACISRDISKSLRGRKGGKHWESIVGYTLHQLINHLEKQFKPGMTWENYGTVWHIDHKIPVSVFNFKTYDDIDFQRCWELKNLQPMFAFENKSKGNKLSKPFQPSLAFAA